MALQIPRKLLTLLEAAAKDGASDLFLNVGRVPARRIHGALETVESAEVEAEALDQLAAAALGVRGFQDFGETGDADVGLSLPGGQRFRLNLSRQKGHLAIVARVVPSGALEFSDLGHPQGVVALASLARGMVLVTGATGSGKSTTLAAIVHAINKTRAVHIVTVEDPVEYVHDDLQARVSQREIGSDTRSFHSALRHVVRQSPDVIMIGELRDAETMQVALSAALTGHLVLASLHTIDTTQTLHRILNYFPETARGQVAMDLSQCLEGIVSQRLIPRSDGTGRALAVELITCTPPIRQLLSEQKVHELNDVVRQDRTGQQILFDRSILTMVENETVDLQEAVRHASNVHELLLMTRGLRAGTDAFEGPMEHEDSGMEIRSLLHAVLDRDASDLHLTVGRPPILRVDGSLHPLSEEPLTDLDMRVLLHSVMNARRRTEFELNREVDFALSLETGRRFRVNAYYQKGRMAAALRAIPSRIPEPAELGLPESVLDLGDIPHGLLLVVGPTGSGKSTTLACLIDRINTTRSCRIITIEDPIEYAHLSKRATVDQREVLSDTHSFAAALKYILRQDPDVILVGEMRDLETISAAITAAETGHLVLATLHSNDAAQAVDRIVDAFPAHQQSQARNQLSACMLGVVSQRLLPLATGAGRVAAFEVMVGTPAIRTLIRDKKMHQARGVMEASRKDGMVTMDQSLQGLLEQNLVAYEVASLYHTNPKVLTTPRATPSTPTPAPSGDRNTATPAGSTGNRNLPWKR